MLKTILIALLPLLIFFSNGSDRPFSKVSQEANQDRGTLEKMIVADGTVAMDLNLGRLIGTRVRGAGASTLRLDVEPSSFFKTLVYNGEFRGVQPSSMDLRPISAANLPSRLNGVQLAIESLPWGEAYELIIRDAKTGFRLFNVEGQEYGYDAGSRTLCIQLGRLLITDEFARELGRPADAGSLVGTVSVNARMQTIEVSEVVNGETRSALMPTLSPEAGTVPGPDVVVGELSGLAQFGSAANGQVGLAIGTDSCNFGTVPLNWFANPSNDHPVIPQNMYRMSPNGDRFEQIGQSSVKHAFTALQNNICNLGCVSNPNGTALGSGCSDPYGAGLNAGPNLGSRAWINPFTGFYPRGDSATPNNSHGTHTHLGPSHRILTNISDLSTSQNAGATYFAEGQYITPHEYAWCQTHPGQCNMYNNVSYRQYNVSGTTSFTFSAAGSTQRMKPAINAWTGATIVEVRPDPGADGIGFIAYKVTNPSPGVWHYEYAVYNQNLDRGIQSFSVPTGSGVTLSNLDFHAPPQHPGWDADGTVASAGYSSAPWTPEQTSSAVTWSSESMSLNANANAIRWGTLYNFRFDSNRPPQDVNATVGFFKTGSPVTVQVQGPSPIAVSNASISGRVTKPDGTGIAGAYVYLNDPTGIRRQALTNPFGHYQFDNVLTGQTYSMFARSRFYTFPAPVNVAVSGNVTGQDFVALP